MTSDQISKATPEFSFRTRQQAITRLKSEVFDVLIIGGGITGAAAARDAASRGLRVALIEKRDFAWGTSSRSSKLIHGGLRYLENMEFHLVFEALSERAFLLKTAPNRVRPLPFYFPVYQADPHGMGLLSLGFVLYDLLSLFRTPGGHRRLSKQKLIDAIPFLKQEGLSGGFRYFDASMWDDGLAVETLRSAQEMGAVIVNYAEGESALWQDGKVTGFQVRDLEDRQGGVFPLRAHRTVLCAGPWTDQVGASISKDWKTWLAPSKGTHLIFDLKRVPVPGAMVMTNPKDGRIAFVIPRPDFGAGIAIVGTTDGPSPVNPEEVEVSSSDVTYLMGQLNRYFPKLNLSTSDIRSAYVGVRPLFAPGAGGAPVLQKVSREHHIDTGPGGVVVVAGGKYTTARTMGEHIIQFLVNTWREDVRASGTGFFPNGLKAAHTKVPINPRALPAAVQVAKAKAMQAGLEVPSRLYELYGADAIDIAEIYKNFPRLGPADPEGFPHLEAVLRWSVRNEMVLHLEDFFFRRVPLFLALTDHGLPWLPALAQVLGQERGLSIEAVQQEVQAVQKEMDHRMAWKKRL